MTTYTKAVAEKIGTKERDIDLLITRQSIWETPSTALLIQISDCDATTDWTGTDLLNDTSDKKEGSGSLKDSVASPSTSIWYDTIYNPPGSWNWSAKEHILFWFKGDRASTVFADAVLVIYDTSNKYRYWDLTFLAEKWTAVKKLLSTGDGEGGTPPDLALIDKVQIEFRAGDTTAFYKKIDDVRVITPTIWSENKIIEKDE